MLGLLFLAAIEVQCVYALFFFARMLLKPSERKPANFLMQPVSIIICARNEAANLEKNLPPVLAQQYKDGSGHHLYEVVVVDDASTDQTQTVLNELKKKYAHLKTVHVAKHQLSKGKKGPLSAGIKNAAHNWLLFTDADCVPAGDTWLQHMVAPLSNGKAIVAGYGGYFTDPSLLNSFIRWETMHTWLQYSTYAWAGLPYMAVGRNMACTRECWLRAQQDPLWDKLPYGDDDLFIAIAGNAHNTAVVGAPAAHTSSAAKTTWGDWIRQKQRHLSTGKYYRPLVKILLGLYAISHAVMWLTFIALVCIGDIAWAPVIMSVRCGMYWLLWSAAAARLHEKKLWLLLPAFDAGWLIYNFAFLPYITWKNKKQWT